MTTPYSRHYVPAKRKTVKEFLKRIYGGNDVLPRDLFGYADLIDFEFAQYVYFLDNVATLSDLRRGLLVLSPLADDALDAAEQMGPDDFMRFKYELAKERSISATGAASSLPKEFARIVMPIVLFEAQIRAQIYCVSLGLASAKLFEFRQ